jgi:hypothetical protein
MHSLSKNHLAHSRNIQADILQKVAVHKRCYLAQSLNVDATTIGRWLDSSQAGNRLEQFATLLAICELKVVPIQMQCYDQHKIDILFYLAKDSFDRFDNADAFFMTSINEKGSDYE